MFWVKFNSEALQDAIALKVHVSFVTGTYIVNVHNSITSSSCLCLFWFLCLLQSVKFWWQRQKSTQKKKKKLFFFFCERTGLRKSAWTNCQLFPRHQCAFEVKGALKGQSPTMAWRSLLKIFKFSSTSIGIQDRYTTLYRWAMVRIGADVTIPKELDQRLFLRLSLALNNC